MRGDALAVAALLLLRARRVGRAVRVAARGEPVAVLVAAAALVAGGVWYAALDPDRIHVLRGGAVAGSVDRDGFARVAELLANGDAARRGALASALIAREHAR